MPVPLLVAAGVAAAAGAGAMGSAMSGAGQINDNISDATGRLETIKNRLPGQSKQVLDELGNAYSPYTQGAAGDMEAFRNAVMNGGDLSYADAGKFDYDLQGGIQEFMDPTVADQIATATGAVEGSAANTGGLFSSATGKAIADRAQRISQESWKDALQAAISDRGFQYDVFSGDVDRDREAINFQAQQNQSKTANLGTLTGIGANAVTNLADSTKDVRLGEFAGMNDADIAIANIMMNKQDDSFIGNLGSFLTGGSKAFGAMYGGGAGAAAGGKS